MRIRLLIVALMMFVAACGGTDAAVSSTGAPTTTSGAGTSGTEAPVSTSAPDATENPDTTVTTTTEALRAEGPAAPDFVTVLSDGSQFSLAEHDGPVYLVFWAEW
jgi:ABC-type glycerol-3-phosphate transport system substrate-binding protein